MAVKAHGLEGLDLRVGRTFSGRAFYGICDQIENVLERCTSTLLIGQAGVGKAQYCGR